MKTWTCEICHASVSEIGAYAKLAATEYAHLFCYRSELFASAVAHGREQVLRESENARRIKEESDQRVELERRAREKALAERAQEVAERERTNRIQAALNNPLPPKVEPAKFKPQEPEKPRPDRFDVIEIDKN